MIPCDATMLDLQREIVPLVQKVAAEGIVNENTKILTDSELERLEHSFPFVSNAAFASARERVLASGQSVLQTEDGMIYEVFPDGHRRVVKSVEPSTPVVVGRKIMLQ